MSKPKNKLSRDQLIKSPDQVPKQAREFSAFIYLVCDAATGDFPNDHVLTDIRCFKKGCHGLIQTNLDFNNDAINWECTKCQNNGTVKGWQDRSNKSLMI